MAYRSLKNVLGDGLLTADGEGWKRQRRLISTAFTPPAISTAFAASS
jgi:cytochrome P450